MNRLPFLFPRPYRLALALCAALGAFLIAFPLLTDRWTGEKAFSTFTRRDWALFGGFLAVEIGAGTLFFRCVVRACRLRTRYLAHFRLAGIAPEDCAFVWFDASGTARARIAACESGYCLRLDRFDWRKEAWRTRAEVACPTLQAVRETLCFRYRFLCEETAALFEE